MATVNMRADWSKVEGQVREMSNAALDKGRQHHAKMRTMYAIGTANWQRHDRIIRMLAAEQRNRKGV